MNYLSKLLLQKEKLCKVRIAGIPIPLSNEVQHILMVGTTGSGKTSALDALLNGCIHRGDQAIVLDPGAHALSISARPDDYLLNPWDKRAQKWTYSNELKNSYDYDPLSQSIIPPASNPTDQEWHGYAQRLCAEIMKTLVLAGRTDTHSLIQLATQATAEDLAKFVAGSPIEGLFQPGAEKALASTRFVLTHYLAHLSNQPSGNFSLRKWLAREKGNLYITWRQDSHATIKPLISTWVDILIREILSLPESTTRRIWLFLDEFASLERLASIGDGLTKGRKHGLRIVACLQSTAQLEDIYGTAGATVLRSCFGNLLVLGCSPSDPTTAAEMSKALGEREIERFRTKKWGQSEVQLSQRSIVPVVLPSELTSLAPLNGFLKFSGNYPIARIQLTVKNFPVVAAPFMERK